MNGRIEKAMVEYSADRLAEVIAFLKEEDISSKYKKK